MTDSNDNQAADEIEEGAPDGMIEVDQRLVHIKRGKEIITVEVPEHEIKVLEVIHGQANVTDQGQAENVRDIPASAEDELARLDRTYRGVNTSDYVRMAFPGGASDLRSHGFKSSGAAAKKSPGAQVRNRPRKKAAKKAAK